jgi:hypothetical protein
MTRVSEARKPGEPILHLPAVVPAEIMHAIYAQRPGAASLEGGSVHNS